ncbi:NADP-dependent oxidoreductase [Nostoc sp. 'Peltigera membranacea cyanobiont' N6]|uniref:NADP-dependent oxidoreductase n=1 Tax=Nostoc sp. 'Peltigera membranacea cyanobiont' N6 TaxID=1261031 RepID=UPI000CF318A0|nr:NADP-dependent oxidoreductase [Nostoc sp. 'Peltigera membranacea cyanobiont' N6]AVH64213.1 NADP-dependent oxidoreductase [Nostoc sp. 'Peltigera membranacea cyanobiont' N6]
MSDSINKQILLKSYPTGEPKESDFALVETAIPELGESEILTRTIYLSLDPYMRGRMSDRASYTTPAALGKVMVGSTVSQVVKSNHPQFAEGDFVLGYDGWQAYGISQGETLRKLDPKQLPISSALGVAGMPGMTAYFSLLDIGQPKAGETVVVSAASGAVGAVVGQIAKIKGCRAVGIAGSDEKCDYIVHELGFDAGINRKTQDLNSALKAACPNGIDIYVDHTAGAILETVLQQINLGARIPLVGLISQYNAETPPPGPNLMPLLIKRASIEGFLVGDYQARQPEFINDVSQWLQAGKLKYKEDVVKGLENAPTAFIGLLQGKNFGKLIIQVGDDPTKK